MCGKPPGGSIELRAFALAGLICELVRRINKIVQSPLEGFLLANVGYPNPLSSVNKEWKLPLVWI